MAAHSDRSLRIRRAVGQQAASCRLVNSPWPSGGGGAAVSESVWALRHGRLSVSSVCAGGDEGGDNRTVRPPVPASQPRYRPHAPGSGSASVLVSELCMYACLHACMLACLHERMSTMIPTSSFLLSIQGQAGAQSVSLCAACKASVSRGGHRRRHHCMSGVGTR
jgi:hypothetical protein